MLSLISDQVFCISFRLQSGAPLLCVNFSRSLPIMTGRRRPVADLQDFYKISSDSDQTVIHTIARHTPDDIAGCHYDGGRTIAQKISASMLFPIPVAIRHRTCYQVGFAGRFG